MTRVLVVAAALAAMAAPASAERWSRSFSAGSGAALVLHAEDADVHVTSWNEPRIQIDMETRGYRLGGWGLRPSASQDGNRVRFDLRGPAFELHFGLARRWVRIEVRVPHETALDVVTGDGSVACERVTGTLRIATNDGNVSVEGLRGAIELRTGDGGIEASDLDGTLAATTGDGRVHVQGRFNRLDVTSHDGGVTLNASPGSRLDSAWSVSTDDGPVLLRIPPDLAATLDARTDDGRLSVGMPVRLEGALHEDRMRGSLNGGGPELRVRTGDGGITIEPYHAGTRD
jgi:hypothetical protein